MIKVLMLDGHDRRTLACIRSLGVFEEYEIHVGSSRKINASKFSKYCSFSFRYGDPEVSMGGFLENIKDYISQNSIHVLIPMGENMAHYINENLSSLSKLVKILQPTPDIFEIGKDKDKTMTAAKQLGIPIPESYTYEEVFQDIDKIRYPILIKPRISSASMGMVIVKDKQEFAIQFPKISAKFPNPLIQEFIPQGGGHYQVNAVLDWDSNAVCTVVKNKIREFPVYGGPSTFFRTVDYPLIEDYGIKLLKGINWVGPAEVEFMIDPINKIPKLMEINPRMSATIRLSNYVGINFPKYIVDFALGKSFEKTERNKKFDYFCQWLIPGDFLNFIYNPKRFQQKFGYFGLFRKNLVHMTFDIKDLKPFFIYLYILIASFISPKKIVRYLKRK